MRSNRPVASPRQDEGGSGGVSECRGLSSAQAGGAIRRPDGGRVVGAEVRTRRRGASPSSVAPRRVVAGRFGPGDGDATGDAAPLAERGLAGGPKAAGRPVGGANDEARTATAGP